MTWSLEGSTWEGNPSQTVRVLDMAPSSCHHQRCHHDTALDRPDVAYAGKTARQSMAKPDQRMQLRIVGVGRYFRRHLRLVWCFGYQELPTTALSFDDADFAARQTGRREQPWSLDIALSNSRRRHSRYERSRHAKQSSTHSPRQ